MSKFCPHCGSPTNDTAKFCPKCGSILNSSVQSQSANPIAPNPVNSADSSEFPSVVSLSNIKKMFFQTSGRLNRQRYILRGLILFPFNCVAMAFSAIDAVLISVFISIPVGILGIMLSIRRCHDINKSGWFMLWSLVPIANIIIGLMLLIKKGTDGPNHYGPDPLQ